MRSTFLTVAACGALTALFTFASCHSTENANTNAPANTNRPAVVNTNTNANTNRTAAKDYSTPDGMITAKTKLALIADKDVSAFDVDVDTVNDVVTLSGKVETDAAKAAAEKVAKGIDGVKSVNNQLQVVPDAKANAVDDSDDNIKKAVNDWLDNDPTVKDLDLSSEVNAGVVTLKGSVANYGDLVRAADGVRKVKGVKRVVTTAVKVSNAGAGPGNANANANRK
jgi:hyperosmotically inducible protein